MKKGKSLSTEFPEIAKEWHPTKNGTITPDEVAPKSGKTFWWLGKCGHEWDARVATRTNGHGCPYCSGNKVLSGFNDLHTLNPELSKEWHPTKNGDLKSTMVTPNSNKQVWWLGKCGHEWQASIESRNSGNGCPFCNNQQVLKGFNDLLTVNPDLAKEWHPSKNGSLQPDMVMPFSTRKVWWLGKCGHEWQASIAHRSNNKGCPVCLGRVIVVGINDLETTNLELSKDWHPTRNDGLTPKDVTRGSKKSVWWLGKCGHEWKATIKDRANGRGCPICNKESKTSFPEQALFFYIKKYYPDAKNSDTEAIGMELDIFIPSLRIGVEYDGYQWHKDSKSELIKNELCIAKNILLIRIREKGLKLYDSCYCIIRNDNSNNSLNGVIIDVLNKIDPSSSYDVDIGRDKSLIFDLYIINQKSNSLINTHPELAKEWHPTKNGNLKPNMVTAGSNKKVWWLGKCGHEWESIICKRVKGNGCPYCRGLKHPPIKCLETGEIYQSFAVAAASCGLTKGDLISKCCKGLLKTAGGYHWEYVKEEK